jgi:hypothetical protein
MLLTNEQINWLTERAKIFASVEKLYSIQVKPLTMMPYIYFEEIEDYMKWMYANELVVTDYSTIEKDYKNNYANNGWYKTLSEEDVIKCLALAIRRDRFVDGFLAQTITDKSFERLINRLSQIHNA